MPRPPTHPPAQKKASRATLNIAWDEEDGAPPAIALAALSADEEDDVARLGKPKPRELAILLRPAVVGAAAWTAGKVLSAAGRAVLRVVGI